MPAKPAKYHAVDTGTPFLRSNTSPFLHRLLHIISHSAQRRLHQQAPTHGKTYERILLPRDGPPLQLSGPKVRPNAEGKEQVDI